MLQSWLQDLPDDYAVKDLINEVKDWIEEDYVKDTVWKRLQNCIVPGVLPMFSERRSSKKSSGSASPDRSSAAESRASSSSPTTDVLREERPSQMDTSGELMIGK